LIELKEPSFVSIQIQTAVIVGDAIRRVNDKGFYHFEACEPKNPAMDRKKYLFDIGMSVVRWFETLLAFWSGGSGSLGCGYACALKEPKGLVTKALHAIMLLIARRLMHDLEQVPDTIEVHLAPALFPLDVSPFDFSASRYLSTVPPRILAVGLNAAI
jgi:hypothetical protein